ncbi:MAG: heavy-metal-associated domain-containing protein [Acidimicrobiia bacterium]
MPAEVLLTPPTTLKIPVQALTCPGCDCGMCVGTAITSIDLLDGVSHVRVDRLRKQFVVRMDDVAVGEGEIISRIESTGLSVV